MKGDPRIIEKLDQLLTEELTAINQYMVHSEMCDNWGYERLHEYVEKRAFQEMKHAEELICRILFLEGMPTVSQLNPIHIGKDVRQQLESDLSEEILAVQHYNEGIQLAEQAKDGVTRTLLESILKDEDDHVDWLEEQLDQINQMGIAIYLATQTRK